MTPCQARAAAALAIGLVLGQAASVAAQLAPPNRATSNGVFRGGMSASDRPSLGLSGSVYGAYDNDIVAQLTNTQISGRDAQRSGPLYGGGIGLQYRRPGRVDFGASARTGLSYVPDLPNPSATSYGVGSNISMPLTRSLGFQASGRFEYAPRYSLASRLFEPVDEGVLPPLDDGFAGIEPLPLESYRQHLRVGLNQGVGRRGSIGIGYRYHGADFTGVDRDLDAHQANISYRHEIAQDLSARVGYGFQQSRHQNGPVTNTFESSNIIASLDYDRGLTLSMTRRTFVTFGFGTGVAQRGSLEEQAGQGDSRLFLTGRVSLLHEMGRTWSTEVGYSRGLRFVDGFAEPLLTGNLIGRVGGLITRRLQFGAFTRIGRGSGVSTERSAFNNIQSSMQLGYGLSRFASMFAQVYHTWFEARGRSFDFPVLVPSSLNRLGVRVGVSLGTPLLN